MRKQIKNNLTKRQTTETRMELEFIQKSMDETEYTIFNEMLVKAVAISHDFEIVKELVDEKYKEILGLEV